MRWALVGNGEGDRFLIPEERLAEWRAYADLDPDDERKWTTPKWAVPVQGELLTFDAPLLDGSTP